MIIQLLTEEGIRNLQESILALVIKGDGFADVVAKVKEQTDALGQTNIWSLDESIWDPKRKKTGMSREKAESKENYYSFRRSEYKKTTIVRAKKG